jgi:hypothetical protein
VKVNERNVSVTFQDADTSSLVVSRPIGRATSNADSLEQAEQFEHDYDNDNHSNYVKDVSAHGGRLIPDRACESQDLSKLISDHGIFFAAKICLTNRRS